jgi:hypothetical protein
MLGAIPCLANLSDEDRLTVDFPDGLPEGYIEQPNLESLEFIAAATYAGVAYAREACQPCADGSRAIDPRKNWDFLMSQVPPAAATA